MVHGGEAWPGWRGGQETFWRVVLGLQSMGREGTLGSWLRALSSSLCASLFAGILKLFQSLFKDVAMLALSSLPNLTSHRSY